MFQLPPPNAKELTTAINILLPELLWTIELYLFMPLHFKQLPVGLTIHVYRGLPARTPGRGLAGQRINAVAGSTLRGSRRPHPSAKIAGVSWRAIGTGITRRQGDRVRACRGGSS